MTFEIFFNLEGLLIFNHIDHIVHIENIAFAWIFSTAETAKVSQKGAKQIWNLCDLWGFFNLEGLLIFNHIVYIENIAFSWIFSTAETAKVSQRVPKQIRNLNDLWGFF